MLSDITSSGNPRRQSSRESLSSKTVPGSSGSTRGGRDKQQESEICGGFIGADAQRARAIPGSPSVIRWSVGGSILARDLGVLGLLVALADRFRALELRLFRVERFFRLARLVLDLARLGEAPLRLVVLACRRLVALAFVAGRHVMVFSLVLHVRPPSPSLSWRTRFGSAALPAVAQIDRAETGSTGHDR